MAFTDRTLGVELTITPIASMIQTMSGMRLNVAMMSNQKKKLYLKSVCTIEFMKISIEKRTKETTRKE